MKSLKIYAAAATVCLLASVSIFAQHVLPPVSLGDPVPVSASESNVMLVNGSSSNCCPVKLGFEPCADPAKGSACGCKDVIVNVPCTGACQAPACVVAAKAAPCKACDVPKLFQHAAAPCSTCSTPVPVACAPCAAKPVYQVAKPAPCGTCAAPAPCKTCDPCSAGAHKTEYRRPILDAIKNFFSSSSHHTTLAKADVCTTCVGSSPAPAAAAAPSQPSAMPTALPQSVSYQNPAQSTAPVPAALAPYSFQAPVATSLPPADIIPSSR